MPADDFYELGGESVTALMDTKRGDRVMHHIANDHPWHSHAHEDKESSRSRSRRHNERGAQPQRSPEPKGSIYAGWSIKSLFRGGNSDDQKKKKEKEKKERRPRAASEPHRSPPPVSPSESQAPAIDHAKESRQVEERRERFRHAKNSYIPVQATRDVNGLQFDLSRMQADVGKAVKDAAGRCSVESTRRW